MSTLLVIGTIATTSAGAGGRADAGASRASGKSPQATVSLAPPADQPSEVAYWHRWSQHWKRKAMQWKRAYLKLRASLTPSTRHTPREGRSSPASTRSIICSVFGAHCSEALRVAWCESRFNVYARNGQYWGLFQMGSFARGHYGHSWTAYGQARAAYRYFLDAGWSPWSCRP